MIDLIRDLLLGIDIGTSACKIAIHDLDGHVVTHRTAAYETWFGPEDEAEQDALDWWAVVRSGLQSIFEEGTIKPEEIKGIGVDGFSWTCLPLDKSGQPLRKAMIWMDRRAKEEALTFLDTYGDRLLKTSGNPVDAAYVLPKMKWIEKNEPKIYAEAATWIQANSFIVYKLTGILSQDKSQGYGFHYYDIKNSCWDKDLMHEVGVCSNTMPNIYDCHEVVGSVSEEASELTGLKIGTPVVAGGLDAACCTLGAGVIRKGETQEQGGQAGGMSIVINEPHIHEKLILGHHVVPKVWLLQGGTVAGGGTLKWLKSQLNLSSFEEMSALATDVRPGSDGLIFLPYLSGERSPIWDPLARGMYFGLGFEQTPGHLVRAAMEGVGYALQHNLGTAEEAGAYVDQLASVGGAANSDVWMQIKADITGKTMVVPNSDHATTLGAAVLAGVGVGLYKDFELAVKKTVRVQKSYQPDLQKHKVYEAYYDMYIDLYKDTKAHYVKLSDLRRKGRAI